MQHLQLEAPAYIKMLPYDDSDSSKTLAGGKADCVQFPVPLDPSGLLASWALGPKGTKLLFTGLAYTAPFRVLSDEGLRVFNKIILANEQFATSVPSLVPKCIRGLGYRSQFVRDLNYCEPLLDHLSSCAGVALAPHGMGMNLSQINFGEIGAGPVNQWHTDSTPFVMVILLSDATDMVTATVAMPLYLPHAHLLLAAS